MASTLFSPGTVVSSVWLNEVDTATHTQLLPIGGTANALTVTGPVSMLSYVTGQTFRFVPSFTNTGASTINISGLGVKSITKYGFTALVAGDLLVGMVAEIVYDGTNFQLSNPRTVAANVTGRLIGTQSFFSTAVYTPTTGTTFIIVELLGGGGAGGGTAATGGATSSVGAGGGSGGYLRTRILTGFSGQTVTVGNGGSAVVGGIGGSGSLSSFGAIAAVNGGNGGNTVAPTTIGAANGGTGGTAVAGNILNIIGGTGSPGSFNTAGVVYQSGAGATSPFGTGGPSVIGTTGSAAAGVAGTGFGSGGSGAASAFSSSAIAGGSGAPGYVIVYEYS